MYLLVIQFLFKSWHSIIYFAETYERGTTSALQNNFSWETKSKLTTYSRVRECTEPAVFIAEVAKQLMFDDIRECSRTFEFSTKNICHLLG